jgi:hypothetical protein
MSNNIPMQQTHAVVCTNDEQEQGYYDTYDDYDETQEDAPVADGQDGDEQAQDIYTTRSHSSTRRYPRYVPTIAAPRTVMRVTHHQGAPIQRASLRQPYTTRTHEPTQEPVTQHPLARSEPRSTRTRAHWFLYVGGGMALAFVLLALFSWVSSWVSQEWEDAHYGYPRTYQVDANVKHGGISHFLVENLNGRVIIYEMHPDHLADSKVYQGPILEGAGVDQYPATIRFADVNGDGLPDMIISFHDTHMVLINANGGFRPVTPADHITGGNP